MLTKCKAALALAASCLIPVLAHAQYRPNPFTTNAAPGASNYVVQITRSIGSLPLQAGSNITITVSGNSNIISSTGGGGAGNSIVNTNGNGTNTTLLTPTIIGGASSNQTVANPVIISPVVSGNAYVFGNQTNTGDFQARDANLRNVTAQSITVPGPLVHYDTTGVVDLKSPTNNVVAAGVGAALMTTSTNPATFALIQVAQASSLTGLSNYVAASAQTFNGPQNGFASFSPETVGSWVADQLVLTNGDSIDPTNIWFHDANICVTPNGMVMLTYGCTTNGYTGPNYPHIRWRQAKSIAGLQTTTNYGNFPIAPYGQRLNAKVKVFDGVMWMVNYAGPNTNFEVAPLFAVLSYCSDGTGTNWTDVGVIATNKAGSGHFDADKVYMTELNYVPGRPDPWVCTYYGSWSNDSHCAIGMSTATNPFVAANWHQLTAPIISNNACGLSPTMRYLPNLGWMFYYYNYLNSSKLDNAAAFIVTNQWFEFSTNYLGPFDINVYDPNNYGLWFGNNGSFFDDTGPALTRVAFPAGNKIVLLRPYSEKSINTPSVRSDSLIATTGSFGGSTWGTNFYHPDGRQMFYPAGTNHILFLGAGDSSLNAEYSWSNSLNYYYDPLFGGHITNSASQWIISNKGSSRYGKIDSTSILGSDWTNINGTLPNPVTKSAMLAMLFHMSTNTIPADTNNPVVYLSLTNSDGNVYRIKAYQ